MRMLNISDITLQKGVSSTLFDMYGSEAVFGFIMQTSSSDMTLSLSDITDTSDVIFSLDMKTMDDLLKDCDTSWITRLDKNKFEFKFTKPLYFDGTLLLSAVANKKDITLEQLLVVYDA